MCFVCVDILERYVARFTIVRSFLDFCIRFLLDVDGGDGWRGLFLGVGLVDGVHEPCVPDHVASVRGRVRTTVAAVDLLSRNRWAR